MSDARHIIAPGKTMTGRKLREAILSATGAIVGGRGIVVSTINGQSVVSITGHTPRPRGGAIAGFVRGSSQEFNPTYNIESADKVSMPVTQGFPCKVFNRMFDTVVVDFRKADDGDLMQILPLAPTPLEIPEGNLGGCVKSDGSGCFITTEGSCSLTGFFLGMGSPCAMFTIAEHVKISFCPAPSEPTLAPPPILNQELLA